MAEYNVILKDAEGHDTVADVIEGMTAAKRHARYLISDDFARYMETTHESLQTSKAEVHNVRGECVWDVFR